MRGLLLSWQKARQWARQKASDFRQRAWEFLDLAKRGLLGLLAALLLVGGTVLLDRWFGGPASALDTVDPALTVLGTVVTFFAVATLAVSVSLTLLQSAAGQYNSDVVEYFAEDPDRETLLHLIFFSFLVSLANLCLLAIGLLHPFSSLILPVSLAGFTLLLMVGYIYERVRLFSAQRLTDRLVEETLREIYALDTTQSGAAKEARERVNKGLRRLVSLAQSLCEKGRILDAAKPLLAGAWLIAHASQEGLGLMDPPYWDFWEVVRKATKDGDRNLASRWLARGFDVQMVKSMVENAPPVLGNLIGLTQALKDSKSKAIRKASDFMLAEQIIEACGQVASAYWTDGDEASKVKMAKIALGVASDCLELAPDHEFDRLLEAVYSNFHQEILGLPDFARLVMSRLVEKTKREIAAEEARERVNKGLRRLASLAQSLCKRGRMLDAEKPLWRGAELMADASQKGLGLMGAHGQFWEVILEATKDGDRNLAVEWLRKGIEVQMVKSRFENAPTVLGRLSALAQVLKDGKSTATKREDFMLTEQIIKTCGQVASAYWTASTDRGEASEVERAMSESRDVVNQCLELFPDYQPGDLLEAVYSNFHQEVLGHPAFADLAPRAIEARAKAKA